MPCGAAPDSVHGPSSQGHDGDYEYSFDNSDGLELQFGTARHCTRTHDRLRNPRVPNAKMDDDKPLEPAYPEPNFDAYAGGKVGRPKSGTKAVHFKFAHQPFSRGIGYMSGCQGRRCVVLRCVVLRSQRSSSCCWEGVLPHVRCATCCITLLVP